MPDEIHPFLKYLCICVYVSNMYVLFFRLPDNESKFGSISSVMNISKLNSAETGLEVSLVVYYSER